MATQVDLGKIRPVWKGDWVASTAYEQNDMVKVGVDSYICTAAHTSGSTFADTNWDVLAVGAEIPAQTGNSGQFLGTTGTDLQWQPVITKVVNVEHFTGKAGRITIAGAGDTTNILSTSSYTAERSDTFLLITADIHGQSYSNHYGISLRYNVNGSGWVTAQHAVGSRGGACVTYDDNNNNSHNLTLQGTVPNSAFSAGDTIQFGMYQHNNGNDYAVYGGSQSGWESAEYGRGNHVVFEIVE